ncbi:NAC domain-containing protein [Tanacetum coccineum]|uniref:NAC domain-containing protein n=1 Tax=Tanacetum coccineum TaxID=301880 RepID=A0ABQ4WLP5_9ASTR
MLRSEANRWEMEAEQRNLNNSERGKWLEARKSLVQRIENEAKTVPRGPFQAATWRPDPVVDHRDVPEPLANYFVYEESDDDIKVTLAYTPSLPFLTTMEPADTLLMGDEVISTTPARETNKFIKSSIDDLVPIPKESKVTSDSNLECDMHVNTPLPPTDVREENFDINSPPGEYVVDFLMKNEDITDLPRHLVKQLFSYLLKHSSSTKRMSDEPLGDDSKPRSYDVTFSNPLFDFNDDYTLCYDNPLFNEEFEDISSLDPPKSTPLNYEPLGNPDSVSRSLKTSDLNFEELTAEIGLDDLIPTKIDDGYYDSEGDILFLEHLLIEETFSDLTPAVLPKKSTLLVTPPPASKQFSLREVDRFDPFFSLTQSGGKTRVMETHSFSFHYMTSPRRAAYSPKEVMCRYYHPHLTSGDGFDPEIKNLSILLRRLGIKRFGGNKEKIEMLRSEANRWEMEAEQRNLNNSERGKWLEARKSWLDKEREYCNMLRQKTRIKWDAKGDVQRIENEAKTNPTRAQMDLGETLESIRAQGQAFESHSLQIEVQYEVKIRQRVSPRYGSRGVQVSVLCQSTRSSSSNLVPPSSDPESIIRNRQRNLGDPSLLLDFEEISMNPNNVQGPPPAGPPPQNHNGPPGLNLQNPALDLQTMEELLQAPTDGVGDAIVVPPILANQFELKIGLLNLITAISFHGFANDDPHSHIRRFMKITQTIKLNQVPHDSVNQLFPPSGTTNLRNEIKRFQQKFDETFSEAWDLFKDLLNKCPHHGLSHLHQIDTFYNGLNQSDQDSLKSAAVLSASGSSSQNDVIIALTKQVEALVSSMNKPIHSIQDGCETCGGPHSYYECQAAGGYTQDVYATTGNYNSGGNSYQP